MTTLREWVSRFWGTLRRNPADCDLEEELRVHLELAADDERRRTGLAEHAARTAAIRFGDPAERVSTNAAAIRLTVAPGSAGSAMASSRSDDQRVGETTCP